MTLWTKTRAWAAAHPCWTLVLVTCLALGPCLAKPFNIDDPLFIWTARQIQSHPLDPYGFNVNWYGRTEPMWNVMENPPLASYYMAAAAGFVGWSEIGLHTAFLMPAIAAVLGTFRLARRFCDKPIFATFAMLLTPAFLVSSTSVMCDVLMLALWIWAVVFWVEGIEQDKARPIFASIVLITLASLTKYFGICLAPLLAVYTIVTRRRVGWLAALFVPVIALCGWQAVGSGLYHQNLLLKAVDYTHRRSPMPPGARMAEICIALTFTGGCMASVAFLVPWMFSKRAQIWIAAGSLAAVMAIVWKGTLWQSYLWIQDSYRPMIDSQVAVWATGGVFVLALALSELWRNRNAAIWLLALWVAGTFVFAAFVNWTVNARSLLPMAPALGILAARRAKGPVHFPLIAGAILGLLVTRSDYLWARAVRDNAVAVHEQCGGPGHTLWFQGHWGFQYYLTALGGKAVEKDGPPPAIGDVLAIPLNNTSLDVPPGPKRGISTPGPGFVIDMNMYCAAGFYSALGGPLPFVFWKGAPDFVAIYSSHPPANN